MRVHVYFISRNTNCNGELSPSVEVWYRKPQRYKLRFDKGYHWLPSPHNEPDLGLFGSYTVVEATRIFKTVPDTDLELIKCEQNFKD